MLSIALETQEVHRALVGRTVSPSLWSNQPSPLAQVSAGCWDLWDELGVQPKFSLLVLNLSCSVVYVTPQSHSTTKPCFKNSSAYKVGPRRCVTEDMWLPLLLLLLLSGYPSADTKLKVLLTLPEKTAAQKALCQPNKHKIKRKVQILCKEKRMFTMLVQGRKEKSLQETPLNTRNLLIAVYPPESTQSVNSVTELNITLTSFISCSLWS